MFFLLKENDGQWHSFLDELSHVLQPNHVLLLILAHHVLVQPVMQRVLDPPHLKIPVKGLLQALVQITVENNE